LEINAEGSTMDRFLDLTERLLSMSHEEIMQKEKDYKEEQRKKKRKKPGQE